MGRRDIVASRSTYVVGVRSDVNAGRWIINRENALGVFSFHPGGANFAMCDGSVHFFAEDMDRFALQALFTREQLDNLRSP